MKNDRGLSCQRVGGLGNAAGPLFQEVSSSHEFCKKKIQSLLPRRRQPMRTVFRGLAEVGRRRPQQIGRNCLNACGLSSFRAYAVSRAPPSDSSTPSHGPNNIVRLVAGLNHWRRTLYATCMRVRAFGGSPVTVPVDHPDHRITGKMLGARSSTALLEVFASDEQRMGWYYHT